MAKQEHCDVQSVPRRHRKKNADCGRVKQGMKSYTPLQFTICIGQVDLKRVGSSAIICFWKAIAGVSSLKYMKTIITITLS